MLNIIKTRMHSSRMLSAGGDLPQCLLGYTPLGVDLKTPLHVGLNTPSGVGLDTPSGVGLETPKVWAWKPPWPDQSTSPQGVGLETPRPDPSSSPWVLTWTPARHAGIPPHPTCGQNSGHTLLKILPCPNFIVGGNDRHTEAEKHTNAHEGQ